MSVNSKIVDSRNPKQAATVEKNGAVRFMETPLPPFGDASKMRVFRQFFTTDGTATGTSDMLVNGSSTNVDYYIPASQTKDRYITQISFIIADASLSLNQWGNITALTNGCQLLYDDEEGQVTIHEALKTNWDVIRLCGGNPPIGATTSSFIASNVSGNSEGVIPVLDFRERFGFRWGLRLAVGTRQRLTFRIRDNISAPDQTDIIAYGFERAE